MSAVFSAQFVEAGRLSVEKLAQSIDTGTLERAVDLLSGAANIHLVGFRRAFPVVSYLSYAFEKMAVPAILYSGVGNLGTSHVFTPGDAMIAVSFAPYTEATVNLAREAAERRTPVVAMTDLVTSPLLRSASVPLMVNEIEVGAFRSLGATLTLAMVLAVAVGARRSAG